MTDKKMEKNKGQTGAPEAPVNPQELEQIARLYNGFNLFHKGQMLTFLAKDILIQSPEGELGIPMAACEVGIAGTTLIVKLPGAENTRPSESNEVGSDASAEKDHSIENQSSAA